MLQEGEYKMEKKKIKGKEYKIVKIIEEKGRPKTTKEEIEFLDHSNRIERVYNPAALEDAKKAWAYAKKYSWRIDLRYVLHIHYLLMKNLRPDIAGRLRDCAVRIGYEIKEAKPLHELQREVNEWAEDAQFGNSLMWKKSHIAFEYMHPFEDGNGRVGRILMNIHRLNSALPLLIIHEGQEQQEYYGWFTK